MTRNDNDMTTTALHLSRLQSAMKRLNKRPWFSDGWSLEAYTLPAGGPAEYACLQMTKANWFNQAREGIHIETWIGPKEAKQRKLPIELHILHVNAFPGTKLGRSALTKPLLAASRKVMSTWPGYSVSNNTMRPLAGRFAYADETIDETVAREFERLHVLGTTIDGILRDLMPK